MCVVCCSSSLFKEEEESNMKEEEELEENLFVFVCVISLGLCFVSCHATENERTSGEEEGRRRRSSRQIE